MLDGKQDHGSAVSNKRSGEKEEACASCSVSVVCKDRTFHKWSSFMSRHFVKISSQELFRSKWTFWQYSPRASQFSWSPVPSVCTFCSVWVSVIHRRTVDDATCKFWFLRPRRCHLVLQILVLLTVPLLTLTEWTPVPAAQGKRNSKITFRNLRSSQYSLSGCPKWSLTSPRSTTQWVVQQRNSKSWNKIAVLSQPVSSPWKEGTAQLPVFLGPRQHLGPCPVIMEDIHCHRVPVNDSRNMRLKPETNPNDNTLTHNT